MEQLLQLISHDVGCALGVLFPIGLACWLTVWIAGQRGNRSVAFAWGLLAGTIVAIPAWYLLVLSWRNPYLGRLEGIETLFLLLLDLAAAVVVGAAISRACLRRGSQSTRGSELASWRARLPIILLALFAAAAIGFRVPEMHNEYVWGLANERLLEFGLQASWCEQGDVVWIEPELGLAMQSRRKRTAPGVGFVEEVIRHRKLRHLSLEELNIRDSHLQELARLPELENLEVGSDWVTDKGAIALQQATRLRRLTLKCPAVTDAATTALNQLVNLDYLDLEDVPLTDRGLWELRNLPVLESLKLRSQHITVEGLAEFQAATQSKGLIVSRGFVLDPASDTYREIELPRRAENLRKSAPASNEGSPKTSEVFGPAST